MKPAHYKAFISYSHRDERWARWLQKALESYRLPRRLVGTPGADGPIPPRLSPIFRDREDLSSAADLTASIKRELEASESLIVICSPAAAESRWVGEEIRYFRDHLGRGDRIFALVVDGDPQAEGGPGDCFPPILRRDAAGVEHEPLAADARRYADGRALARLKLVAGILGIRLDELRRRDAQRRTRRWFGWSVSGVAVFALIGWLAWSALSTQEAARRQRANTEELLGFMLGDLKRLDPIVGLEVVDDADPVLAGYRSELGFDLLDDETLIGRALEWREAGIAHHQRGELAAAMELFQRSRAALVELHGREGSTRRALFELGQAEFWVGYVYMDRGQLDEADLSFARYGAVTRRLVNAEPNDAAMVMELAYTLTNLGAIERARQNPDTARTLQLFQSAVQYNQMALVLDPGNTVYRSDLVVTLAFLADAWLETCDLGNAFSLRRQSVDLSAELQRLSPGDPRRTEELAYALSGLAGVQQAMGLTGQAEESLAESRDLLAELHDLDENNVEWRWQALLREQRLARLVAAQGRTEEAWAAARDIADRVEAFFRETTTDDFLVAVEAAQFRADYGRLADRHGDAAAARRTLQRAIDDLAALVAQNRSHREGMRQLALATFAYWDRNRRLPGSGVMEHLRGFLDDPRKVRHCSDAGIGARLALLRGDRGLARDYTDYVLGKGYFEPEFVAFCRDYRLCALEPGDVAVAPETPPSSSAEQ